MDATVRCALVDNEGGVGRCRGIADIDNVILHVTFLVTDFGFFQTNRAQAPGKMSEPPRKRAKLACVTCNARRVKCDVTDRHPCSNCAAGNVECETRESRRGKHIRKPRAETEVRSKT